MEQKETAIISNIQKGIDKIKNNEHRIVFVVPDTKGNARASVAVAYQHAKILKEMGYQAVMLTEKKDYIKVGSWLGLEYDDLPHYSIEENNLQIGASDFLVVPEVFGNMIESTEKLPMEKIMFIQAYDYMLDNFSPGKSWLHYGTHETMTTTPQVAQMIEDTVRMKNVKVVPVAIPDYFTPSTKPQQPIVAIHCRETRKTAKLIKQFYLKYPLLKFISFKDMHGLTNKDFASQLKDCCLAVWLDPESTLGTFPLEAMKCNVPVVGKVPNIVPEWMNDDTGIWVYDETQMVDMMATFIQNWLEDTIPENYKNVSAQYEGKYTIEQTKEAIAEVYPKFFENRIAKLERIKERVIENAQVEETQQA